MTAYIDAQGRRWDTAEEALAEFVSDLPAMTDEETENLFSLTRHDWDAARNLAAIDYAATYHGLAGTVLGYYPIPVPEDKANTVKVVSTPLPPRNDVTAAQKLLRMLHDPASYDPGWRWDGVYMLANETDWDMKHVPFFQAQRQYFNRRMLAATSDMTRGYSDPISSTGLPKAEFYPQRPASNVIMGSDGKDHPY